MKAPVKILVVEHDPFDIEFLQRELKQSDLYYEIEIVSNRDMIESTMLRYQPDIILSDYNLPTISGMEVFGIKEQALPYTPFIFVSGTIGEENAIECIKSGVTDYVLKDKLYALPVKIKRALNEAEEKQEKLKAEKRLVQSEMNLSAIFNNTDTGFLLLDTGLNVVVFNKKMNEITLLVHGQELKAGENIADVIRTERRKELTELMEHIAEGNRIKYETCYPQLDGIDSWFSINGKPVVDDYDKVVGICMAINNITESKMAARKLDEMVKELTTQNNTLQKTNMELDRFVYSTSHDLRAPLLSLLGLIEMCADYKKEPDHLDNLFSMMTTSINRVDETIKSILFYSRNMRTEVKPELLNIKALADEQLERMKFMRTDMEIKFLLDIDSKTPFYSDKARVTSVISNLLSNAIKYQRNNEANPTVKLTFKIDDSIATLTFEDNGEGIPQKLQGKVFDMFMRGSVQSTGSGLGLYICREMVEKLGGSIKVFSETDKGSVFTVSIPNLIPQKKIRSESSFIH